MHILLVLFLLIPSFVHAITFEETWSSGKILASNGGQWNPWSGCYNYSFTIQNDPCNPNDKVLRIRNIMGDDNGNCEPPHNGIAGGTCTSPSGQCFTYRHRAELEPADYNFRPEHKVDWWLGFRVFVPKSRENLSLSHVISQFISDAGDSSDWTIWTQGNNHWRNQSRGSLANGSGADTWHETDLGEMPYGAWTHFVNHYRRSTDNTGIQELWMNGVKVVSRTGITSASSTFARQKPVSIYRGQKVPVEKAGEVYDLYFDDIKIVNRVSGNQYAAVAPTKPFGVCGSTPPPVTPPPIIQDIYGRALESCETAQIAGTNGLVIVPDNEPNLETAIESNTSKTILVKEGVYTVSNTSIGAGNIIKPYDCASASMIITTTSDNTIDTDGWTIAGMDIDCNQSNRDCLRMCGADNWTLRNNDIRQILRGGPNVTCNSTGGTLTGNIIESCENCVQKETVIIGDISNPGGVGCTGEPCRYGLSPSQLTVSQNKFLGNNVGGAEDGVPTATGPGTHMFSINGYNRTGLSITNNLFSNFNNYWAIISLENNWLRPGNSDNGGAVIAYNTFIGPFAGNNSSGSPSGPAIYFNDSIECKAANDCPTHKIHHNYFRDSYSTEASSDGRRLSGAFKGHSSKYATAVVEYNIDDGDNNVNIRSTDAVHGMMFRNNTFYKTGFYLDNEICTDTHTGDNLTFDDNVFSLSAIFDICTGSPDWLITDNVFSQMTSSFVAGHLDSGNTTTTVAFSDTGPTNTDFTVTTASSSNKGALPVPTISSSIIAEDCRLTITMSPHNANGYNHGPISTVDHSKITVKYDGVAQVISSSSIAGNDIRLLMSACPDAGDVVTFDAAYQWCKDSANIGGNGSGYHAGCLAVSGQSVTNGISGGSGNTFYVDVTCGTNGDGTTATCGASGPWNSIKNALQVADCAGMASGDVLEIKGDASLDLTCENGGSCYFEDNVNVEGNCNDIIIQNAADEHVVVDGTVDISGATWTSIGGGVYECQTSGCSGDVGDAFAFSAWYDRGVGEEQLTLIQTNQVCDTSLAAGYMRITQATQRICVHLSDGSNPASASYLRVPWYDPFIQAGADSSRGITMRANPSGVGSFRVQRYRKRGIEFDADSNPGWALNGMYWSYMMDRCIAYSGGTGTGTVKITNNIVSFCGQEGIRLHGDLGQFTITGNTITDIQTTPVFEYCQGVGTGCLSEFTDNGTGIRVINKGGSGGTIGGNTILRGGGGKQGRFRGINLENATENVIVEKNYIAHASGLPLEGTAIMFSGSFAGDIHNGNVIRNNRIWDVDRGFWYQIGGTSTTQVGTTNYFINNTMSKIYEYGIFGSWSGSGRLDGTMILQNNIISGGDQSPILIEVPSSGADGWATLENNAFECDSCTTNQDIVDWKGTFFERTEDCTSGTDCVADLPTVLGSGFSGNVYGDINLNESGGEPSLQISAPSVALNTGKTLTLVLLDYVGTARPQDSAFEIGAFEVTGTPSTGQIEQKSHQFYSKWRDEGDGVLGIQGGNITVYPSSFFSLRFSVVANSGNLAQQSLALWARKCTPSCGSWTLVDQDPDAPLGVYIADNPYRYNHDMTTNQMSLDGATFNNTGLYIDADGADNTMTVIISQNEQIEAEYSIGVSSGAAKGNSIEMRLEGSTGVDLDTYSTTPSITIGNAAMRHMGGFKNAGGLMQ